MSLIGDARGEDHVLAMEVIGFLERLAGVQARCGRG